jgi:prephenate dehydrogenase
LTAPVFWPRVGVVGVGLIGGSVAAALKQFKLAGTVVGYAPDDSARQALALGLIDEVSSDLAELASRLDLLVLAAPVLQLPDVLERIAPTLGRATVITDCASTKTSVVAAAQHYLGDAFSRFVPAHPIAGSELSGPTAANVNLFLNARVFVCPQAQTDSVALQQVNATWSAIGARVTPITVSEHDRLFATVSHWPHALVFALSAAIAHSDQSEAAQRSAGAGLRDTTRIGASSPALWAEILIDNRTQVLRAAEEFQLELGAILKALEQSDRAGLEALFAVASHWRKGIAT